jgi:hypothetical protein
MYCEGGVVDTFFVEIAWRAFKRFGTGRGTVDSYL